MKALTQKKMSGREVWPLIEGGKGISVSTGISSGAWAKAGGIGTISGVNADYVDENGKTVPMVYTGKTRGERQRELIAQGIRGGISQARIAHDIAGGNGAIHLNILWEMGGAEEILQGIMDGAKGLIHGVTCGAGMPYKVAELVSKYGVYYYPIVSSSRAFSALWKRAYSKYPEFLGGVVYEDPWLAGGHNGLTNSEDPKVPQDPYGRVLELRKVMRACGLDNTPIIMAGGVWWLEEWQQWIDSAELGPIGFQFGTRPLLTQESPISDAWKQRLLTLAPGDILLHRFSPTGFYSSAVKNQFLEDLVRRSERQIAYSSEPVGQHTDELKVGARGRSVWVAAEDFAHAQSWIAQGYSEVLRTPDSTLVFVTPDSAVVILKDQADCMGCLSQCAFSNFAQNEAGNNGKRADPRSFCIQKTLQNIGHGADVEHELMFSGHYAYRFATDPFYAGGHIPTVQELVDRIISGK